MAEVPKIPPSDAHADDAKRSKEELLEELRSLRRQYVNLRILEFEHEQAVKALRESEERYRQIVETANDIIYRINPRGYFTFANPVASRMIGYSIPEILQKNFTELVRPDFRKAAMRFYLKQTSERIPSTYYEFPAIAKDGREVWIGQLVQIVLEGDHIVELQAVARDISELKRAEVDRRNLEQELRQAQKMESVGRLAGGIAHDFNNILGIILAYTSIMERPNIGPEQTKMSVEAIVKAITRAKGMIRELLTLARKTEPSLELIDINSTISDFTKMIMETFPRTVAFSLDLADGLPGITADPNQLNQVLLNLFVNARDAMPKGGTLTVKTRKMDGELLQITFPEGKTVPYVEICVSDTGVGMDEQTRQRIFEPFFSTKEHGHGSGLGLAVVYGVVKGHHGFIDVESQVGKGSTFRLYFPQGSLQSPGSRQKSRRPTTGGNETILFVEDEDLLREALVRVLEQKGYKVLTAHDGIEAVEMFMRYHKEIAVVLSDLGLPRLGGWEACVTMKEINPNVRIILASGFIDPNLKVEMARAGAKIFVQKPYEPEEILGRIRDIIDQS